VKGTAALSVAVLLSCVPAAGRAGEWPQFRGPGGDGLAAEEHPPLEWSADKNIAWKVKLPGYGWSSPIVWGDKVFVTTAVTDNQPRPGGYSRPGSGGPGGPGGPGGRRPPGGGPRPGGGGGRAAPDAVYRWEIHCLDRATGKTLWKQVAQESKPRIPTQPSNTYASETPVTDGERVYAYFGMTGLFCYDLDGKLIWKKDLGAFPMQMGFGTGSSPVLDGGRLFLQCDNEEKSFLAAFDAKTGAELWRVPRDEHSNWSTPYVWRNKQRTELVTVGTRKVRSYDPASGKLLWELSSVSGGRSQSKSSPVGDAEMLYVGSGGPMGGDPLYAVRAGAAGDVSLKDGETSNAGVAWRVPRAGPPMASPLLYQGYVYVFEQQNGDLLSCYDAKTGKPAYVRERLAGRSVTASPWACDGKVFCLDSNGQTVVVQAGPAFTVLGRNALNEMCWASPAAAGGALILRGVDHLYCIRQ
jgi:outer membrane protein assembly factor BamB